MIVDFSVQGYAELNNFSLVNEMLTESESFIQTSRTARTPATLDLFKIDPESSKLDETRRAAMHSMSAKALYLSKRTRPDLLTAVAFIPSRVAAATEQDWAKFVRLISYLRGTSKKTLKLGVYPSGLRITAYVDASFAVHRDMRSHTGAIITVGRGAIVCFSQKHALVAKSSTEAELIGHVDIASRGIGMRYTLMDLEYQVGMLVLYQDNMSTIHMVTSERGASSRARHINVRYFFLGDRIRSGEVVVKYMPTERFSKCLMRTRVYAVSSAHDAKCIFRPKAVSTSFFTKIEKLPQEISVS